MQTVGQKTRELVALAKEGDNAAIDQLCSVYSDRVRWMVRFRMSGELRSKLESMDLVQETLIRALNGLNGFTYKNEGDFVRWLSRIAENELKGKLRRLHADKRDIRREVRHGDDAEATECKRAVHNGTIQNTTPSLILSRKEDLARLEQAIDRLKPEYRQVIVLNKIDGLSYKEIGDKLGKSTDAVGMLLSRAMVALTDIFESD